MEIPLVIDLFCGLGGWTDGFLAEGYDAIGFDIEAHDYGSGGYPAQLVLQDVLTLHGRQFKDVTCIVASPPCQNYSYMAMPWSKAKAMEKRWLKDGPDNRLFDACFRIQREACEAAGRHIPMVVENVRGAQKWVGRARWNFGSFYLWGDVPALMPLTLARKSQTNSCKRLPGAKGGRVSGWPHNGAKGIPHKPSGHWTNPDENGTKQGGDWFNASQPSVSRLTGSKSPDRKRASAMIAKIPLPLSRWIARVFKQAHPASLKAGAAKEGE